MGIYKKEKTICCECGSEIWEDVYYPSKKEIAANLKREKAECRKYLSNLKKYIDSGEYDKTMKLHCHLSKEEREEILRNIK